jgi:hypothetical protein
VVLFADVVMVAVAIADVAAIVVLFADESVSVKKIHKLKVSIE